MNSRGTNDGPEAHNAPRRMIPIRVETGAGLTAAQHAAVLEACERLQALPGALLPILHAVQAALGYVPPASVPLIARHLNLSVAEVHGCVTFYHYFRATPPGRHVVHLCRAEACQAVGGAALEAHAKRSLGIGFHATTADGAISLEPVYCLGNCALGPSLMIDERLQGRVSPGRFDELMSGCRAAAQAAP
jgi:formate dehydrogenase subunit gamma